MICEDFDRGLAEILVEDVVLRFFLEMLCTS